MATSLYHSDTTRISKSGLDLIRKAPRLYKHQRIDGHGSEDTKSTDFGSAAHCYILENDKFSDCYQIGRDHGNKIPLKQDEYDRLVGMKRALKQHPITSKLLFDGTTEVVHFWTDPITGVDCKMCADYLPARFPNIIVDYKTAKDASAGAFRAAVRRYRYHVQNAFYLDGCASRSEFVFIVQETEAPFLIGVYALPAEDIERGRAEYREDLAMYAECKRTDTWPDYNENKVTML
jgi:hypothetical protein